MAAMDRRDHGHIVVLFRVRTNSDSVCVVYIVLLPLYPADTEKHGTGERHTNGRSSPGRRASGNVHFRTRKINSCDGLPRQEYAMSTMKKCCIVIKYITVTRPVYLDEEPNH